jgi:dCTP diphosphatase
MDDSISLGELRAHVHDFVERRDWYRYHTPKNLAMSIAIEAAEIMEHFQWLTVEESHGFMRDSANKREVADELADVIIYCLSFANATDVDVSEAVLAKLHRNETRFPVEQVRSRLGSNHAEE